MAMRPSMRNMCHSVTDIRGGGGERATSSSGGGGEGMFYDH